MTLIYAPSLRFHLLAHTKLKLTNYLHGKHDTQKNLRIITNTEKLEEKKTGRAIPIKMEERTTSSQEMFCLEERTTSSV